MKKTFIVLALAAALAGCSSLKDRLDKVEDGVSKLETRISDLEERLKNIESDITSHQFPKSRMKMAMSQECHSP